MPSLVFRNSLLTGTGVQNVLLGSQYELAPFDGNMMIGIKADKNLVTCGVLSGPDTLAESGSPVHFGASEAVPIYPDEFAYEDIVAHGDRLKVSLQNNNAATTIVNTIVRLSPV